VVGERAAVDDKGWFTQANRWTQLTFTEDDPGHFDLDRWVDIMRRTRSNGVCISAGGYVAYYPTTVPFHYRSATLGDRDLFGEVVEAARSLGIRVMARVDPHAIHAEAATAHPEWLACAPDGSPLEHWAQPGVWLTCAFSPYHREVVTEIAREIVREYDVDAIFANRWEGHGGISYSESARRSFRDEAGLELPVVSGRADPVWPQYAAWRQRKLSELIVLWNEAVRSVRPRSHFVPNRGALLLRDLDREMLAPYYPAFYIDKQGRKNSDEALWAAGQVGKRSRGMYPDRPVSLITSVGPEHHQHRWKDSVDSAAELQAWIVEGFVHGATPWFTKFSASIYDDRWVQPIADAFGLHAAVEETFTETTPTADVAVLDALVVDDANPFGAYLAESASEDGFNQALIEARTPFEYLAAEALDAERLSGFRLLILPNAEQLSDEVCAVIREFVRGGGTVLADQRSSLAAPDGAVRPDFGLGDVFGVELAGEPRSGERNNYVTFETEHPVCAGFAGATRIVGGTDILPVRLRPGAEAVLRFVPPYPDLPMEEVYPRPGNAAPAVVVNRFGAGCAVYVAFDLGEIFWDALLSDHQRLIANIVGWLVGERPKASVSGPGLVDLAVRESSDTSVVSLVNLDSPFALRGQLRRFDPVGTQVVDLRAPAGATSARVRHLIGGADEKVQVEDDRVRIAVPSVQLLETVRVDWQGA
jgi:hypothetical protein